MKMKFKLFSRTDDENAQLGVAEYFAYGLGNCGTSFLNRFLNSFLVYFYTTTIGLNAAIIGNILLAAQIIDGITDIAMGRILDRTKPKGKLTPGRLWMLRGCILFAVSGVLLTMVPTSASKAVQYVYVFVTYNLCCAISMTVVQLPYQSLVAKMTRNPIERGHISVFTTLIQPVSGTIVSATCLSLVARFGGGQGGYVRTVAIFATCALACHLLCIFGVKERVVATGQTKDAAEEKSQKAKPENQAGVLESFRILVKNRFWIIYGVCILLYFVMFNIMSQSSAAFAENVVGNVNYHGTWMSWQTIFVTVGTFADFFLFNFLGKAKTWRFGAIVVLGAVALQLFGADPTLILVANILKGIGGGMFMGCSGAIMADAMDYSEWKTGINPLGMGLAVVLFAQKLGGGLSASILGQILDAGGYDGTLAAQSASAITAIKICYTYIPLGAMLTVLVLTCFYTLDKMLPEIQAELSERRNGQKA